METPNQKYLREGHKITGFVIHKTEGSFKSAVDWCKNPVSKVSYHFIIDLDGSDICLVMPEDTAWHAGLVVRPATHLIQPGINPNLYTIGIAMSGLASEKPTLAQIAKCASLISIHAKYFNIPIDKNTVIPHNAIRADKICPGLYVSIDSLIYLANLPL